MASRREVEMRARTLVRRCLLLVALIPAALVIGSVKRGDAEPRESLDVAGVTQRNYERVQHGMTLRQVEDVFGPTYEDAGRGDLPHSDIAAPLSIPCRWRVWKDPTDERRWVGVAFGRGNEADGRVISKLKGNW
jgi:hypothetical protein